MYRLPAPPAIRVLTCARVEQRIHKKCVTTTFQAFQFRQFCSAVKQVCHLRYLSDCRYDFHKVRNNEEGGVNPYGEGVNLSDDVSNV